VTVAPTNDADPDLDARETGADAGPDLDARETGADTGPDLDARETEAESGPVLDASGAYDTGPIPEPARMVVSQVYSHDGNADASYKESFIELFNADSKAVNLAGWSLQYGVADGNIGVAPGHTIGLGAVDVPPGHYYLVGLVHIAGARTASVVRPDLLRNTLAISAQGGGKVALVRGVEPLNCGGSASSARCAAVSNMVDLVGYGAADMGEGNSRAQGSTSLLALHRAGAGCVDTQRNGQDFQAAAPSPRNLTSPKKDCVDDIRPDAAGDVAPIPDGSPHPSEDSLSVGTADADAELPPTDPSKRPTEEPAPACSSATPGTNSGTSCAWAASLILALTFARRRRGVAPSHASTD
jgi:hypothetical protein